MRKIIKKSLVILTAVSLAVSAMAGCKSDLREKTVYTQEQAKTTEALKVGDISVSVGMYYLFLIQYVYNNALQSSAVTDEVKASAVDATVAEIQLEMVEYQLAQVTEGVEVSAEKMAEVETSVDSFIKAFGLEFLNCYGITEEMVTDLFTKQAYINAMTDKAIQDLAEEYYDQYAEDYEDMVFQSMYYILFPSVQYDAEGNVVTDAEGNAVTLSDTEMAAQLSKAQEALSRAQSGEKLEDLAKAYGVEHCSGTERNYKGAYSAEINAAVENMKDGEISGIVTTGAGYMIVRMDSAEDDDYKEYVLHYMAVQDANKLLPTLQSNWMSASGVSTNDLNVDVIGKTDLKLLCQIMEAYGIGQ